MQAKTPETMKTEDMAHCARHSRFYFADGNTIFLVRDTFLRIGYTHQCPPSHQVDGVLYNIHKYFLHRDSPIFRDLFSLPARGCEEGSTDERPICLEGTRSIDMERFLSILYPP